MSLAKSTIKGVKHGGNEDARKYKGIRRMGEGRRDGVMEGEWRRDGGAMGMKRRVGRGS